VGFGVGEDEGVEFVEADGRVVASDGPGLGEFGADFVIALAKGFL
jgi:hypothetical protein